MAENGPELFSFHPYSLAHSWNGDPLQGELCIDMENHIRMAHSKSHDDSRSCNGRYPADSLIHGRVIVTNRLRENLELNRIVVGTGTLGLWRSGDCLFADDLIADGLGSPEAGLRMLPRQPSDASTAILVAKPRIGQGDQLVRRSMGLIKSLTNL